MAETKMNVTLLAHTQLSKAFNRFDDELSFDGYTTAMGAFSATDGQAVALSAIRTCYSPGKPSEIVAKEGAKYFGNQATDGAGGTEADRLFRQIVASKHTSTLEHLSFTFAIEGVSRALLAQLTRHRAGFSFSVQSQRYVRFGSGDRSGGFDYVVPDTVQSDPKKGHVYSNAMNYAQRAYDALREIGIPAEDARAVLPNAAACNLVLTANLRALLDFYAKRQPGKGAQGEIAQLAEALKSAVIEVEPWTSQFFEGA
jgi:thymidylate synthase (FAD)